MDLKKIIIIFVVVLMVVGLAWFIVAQKDQNQELDQESESLEPITRDERIKQKDFYQNMIKEKEDTGIISDEVMGTYVQAVYMYNSLELCQDLPDYKIESCLDRYYLFVAREKEDLNTCEEIVSPAWLQICYRDILREKAHKEGDPAICNNNKLENENKEYCLDGF